MSVLNDHLKTFTNRVNETKQLRVLLKKWSPEILIKAEDGNDFFSIEVEDSLIKAVHTQELKREHVIRLEGETKVLEEIFSGQRNPARASIDGLLKIYGSTKDEVKLDAISLILWGV